PVCQRGLSLPAAAANQLELALELVVALLPHALVSAQLLQLASRLLKLARACLGRAESATDNLQLVLERRLPCLSLGAARLLVLLETAEQIVTLRNLGLGLAESAARELELAGQCVLLGTTGPLVFLQPTNAFVTLRKLGFGLAESAARELEFLLEL